MRIDLRSDTVTQPTPPMLEAMIRAAVGDDVYGEDPTIHQLESRVAEHLGFEAGLFVPSGTMANQIAIHIHTQPGTSVIAEEDSHVYLYEAGAAAAQSGVQFDLIPFSECFSDAAIEQRVKPDWLHFATTRLVVVENTHNRGSGRVLDASTVDRILRCARGLGLRTHCDGARLWNAAAATGVHERVLAQGFDTVSVCFSKGLGAPVGSVLVGSKSNMELARKVRKRWGGAMRQVGYLGAAALYALEHHRERLMEDHRRARDLHLGILHLREAGLPILSEYPDLGTNIVYITTPQQSAHEVVEILKASGVLVNAVGRHRLRAVTHLHITDDGIAQTLAILRNIVRLTPG